MKLILALLFFTLSSLAFADSWVLVNEREYEGKIPARIKEIAEIFPEVLFDGEVNVSNITYLYLVEKTFEFYGDHTCADTDPRLRYSFLHWNACESNFCYYGIGRQQVRDDNDPCM